MKQIISFLILFIASICVESCTHMMAQGKEGDDTYVANDKVKELERLVAERNRQIELRIKQDSVQLHKLKVKVKKIEKQQEKNRQETSFYLLPPYQ